MNRKTTFFEGWSWFKLNNYGLALGMDLKFYTSVAKGLKLKVRKFLGLIPLFVEVTEEKLIFCSPPSPPSWIGLKKRLWQAWTLLKKRLWQRCFPVNFAKFLRTPFISKSQSTYIYVAKQWLCRKMLWS